jgi:inosine/xanthosine triphosphate pyrophosphatase family protein
MAVSSKIGITYVTSNKYKADENRIFTKVCKMKDGTPVSDIFDFAIRPVPISETLEVDLQLMVRAEVIQAYSHIKVPCIVEHAGLIFEDYIDRSYPGGLTKPMWNTLGEQFISETNSADRRTIAQAVVAYCDGLQIRTFIGETKGRLADSPRGSREFYWDTVFIPNDPHTGMDGSKTYAEIVESPELGLEYKMINLSQSSKAMLSFLEYLRLHPHSSLW